MIALLSPAKTLEYNFPYDGEVTQAEHLDKADYLALKLKKLSSKQIAKMMHLSPALADLNYDRYQQWDLPFSNDCKPAILAFRGDVYRGMDAQNFNDEELRFAQDHIRILSGLYGVLRPLDLMYPYRLEMGCKFKVTASKTNLYKYWGDTITETLNESIQDHKEKVFVNLASNEYFKAVNTKKLNGRLVECVFKDKKNGEYKVIMTFAKLARGYMSNYIVQNSIDTIDGLKGFAEEGYSYNEKLSNDDQFVFTRE